MTWTKADVDEIVLQSRSRAEKIRALEEELERQRDLRAADARFLFKHSGLTRSAIADICGVSRVTLNDYLKYEKGSAQGPAAVAGPDDSTAGEPTIYRVDPIPVGKNRAD